MSLMYRGIVGSVDFLKKECGLMLLKTHTFYADAIGPGSTIVDLGANVGQFSDEVTQVFGCPSYAVEAVPAIFDKIPDKPLIKKFNYAISNKAGPITLYISSNRECNSVDESIARENGYEGTQTCDGLTLDSFLKATAISKVDLLKIDIEGAEALLFDSTPDTTLRSIGQITIEFHDFVQGSISSQQVSAIVDRLEKLNFYCIPFSYVLPKTLTADFLFVNRDAVRIPRLYWIGFAVIKSLLRLERFKSGLRGHHATQLPTS